jgi:hypothetical protein
MYEAKHLSLAPLRIFIRRVICNLIIGFAIIVFSLAIGMFGYSHFEGMNFVDAYENAAMILSGMGPVDTIVTTGGRIFAGTYALFSGVVFLVVIAVIMAPVFHRFIHRFLIKTLK